MPTHLEQVQEVRVAKYEDKSPTQPQESTPLENNVNQIDDSLTSLLIEPRMVIQQNNISSSHTKKHTIIPTKCQRQVSKQLSGYDYTLPPIVPDWHSSPPSANSTVHSVSHNISFSKFSRAHSMFLETISTTDESKSFCQGDGGDEMEYCYDGNEPGLDETWMIDCLQVENVRKAKQEKETGCPAGFVSPCYWLRVHAMSVNFQFSCSVKIMGWSIVFVCLLEQGTIHWHIFVSQSYVVGVQEQSFM
ncbi:Uncharacterized protein TCM_017003 [Theobroma cacao]|uniref:Uncharacterized protein n=1 Tax=Theobroma cacao TaxID=3641 RepID=A0A061ED45_THECC|nr:Uncharacterized protein TCM_017003 [Theobroma cacao]